MQRCDDVMSSTQHNLPDDRPMNRNAITMKCCSRRFITTTGEYDCVDDYALKRLKVTGRPCTRPVYTGVLFPLPELTARVDGCQKMHPSSRAINSGSVNRPLQSDAYVDLRRVYSCSRTQARADLPILGMASIPRNAIPRISIQRSRRIAVVAK